MPEIFNYLTVDASAEGIYSEKGSKFIACIFPIETEAEVKSHLDNIKKKYPKANHYCYAYEIGPSNNFCKIHDDGEPNGTAGRPIHGQIKSKKLCNVLIIVVRYFGGTLLGTGGLTNAYKNAAAEVISKCITKIKIMTNTLNLNFYFDQLNEVMKITKQKDVLIVTKELQNECFMTINYPQELNNKIMKQLDKITGLRYH